MTAEPESEGSMVGRVIGWSFLGLLSLLLLLLLVPVSLKLEYKEQSLRVWVRVLFLRIRVWPMLFSWPKRAPKETKPKPEKDRPKKSGTKKSLERTLAFLKRILASLSAGARWAMRGIWVSRAHLVVPLGCDDPAELALLYGGVQGVLASLYATLQNILRLGRCRIEIRPDFSGKEEQTLFFSCNVVVSPVIMVVAAVALLRSYLLYRPVAYSKAEYLRAQKQTGGGQPK